MASPRLHPLRRALAVLIVACSVALPLASPAAVPAAPGDRLVAIYRVRPAGDQGIAAEGLAALQTTIQQRLAAYGITDSAVQVQGSDEIRVEIPDGRDARTIIVQTGQIGLCEFVGSDAELALGAAITTSLGGPISVSIGAAGDPASTDGTIYQTLLQNADFADAVVHSDDTTVPFPMIAFTLQETAAQAFGDYTGAHIGQYISIVVDKRVVSSALLRDRINGVAELQGMDLAAMRALAAYVRSAPLILPLELIEMHTATAIP